MSLTDKRSCELVAEFPSVSKSALELFLNKLTTCSLSLLSTPGDHTNMVYTMVIKVDGGCRGNGQQGAIGAAAAVILGRNGGILKTWTCELPNYPRATNQRAEISAIILALELALEKYNSLSNNVYMDVTIMSDSRYAVECMNTWIYKWVRNGWINAKGNEVANQDLIKKASNMDDNLKEHGRVTYKWISRSENGAADEACNNQMDNMGRADESKDSFDSSDSDW
jgi:ribonuclease HI